MNATRTASETANQLRELHWSCLNAAHLCIYVYTVLVDVYVCTYIDARIYLYVNLCLYIHVIHIDIYVRTYMYMHLYTCMERERERALRNYQSKFDVYLGAYPIL